MKAKIYHNIIAYSFLLLYILMAAVNLALMLQIRAMKKNRSGSATYAFRKEKCTLVVILVFFGFSYLTRFVWDRYLNGKLFTPDKGMFIFWLTYDLVTYVDGLSFAALLLFHKSNFKEQKGTENADSHQETPGSDDDGSVVYLNNKTNISSSSINVTEVFNPSSQEPAEEREEKSPR